MKWLSLSKQLWLGFERVAITGMRVEKVAIPEDKAANHEYPYDLVVVKDKKAPVSGHVFMR